MGISLAESVGIGHPDKIADYIADKILEALLEKDINAQLACEVLATQNLVVVAGELSSTKPKFTPDVEGIVKDTLKDLGYDVSKFQIISKLKEQSPDIREVSIKGSKGIVSGDQSVIVGCATIETDDFMPYAIEFSHALNKKLEECIRNGSIKGAKFDFKNLVIIDESNLNQLFFSIQNTRSSDIDAFRKEIIEKVVDPVCKELEEEYDPKNVFINSSGKFEIGGLDADTGVTNRKVVSDSYGPSVRYGGGGYSGKDLTKVDRLGAYFARWICKNLVASEVCNSIELELMFSYGSSSPVFNIKDIDSDYGAKSIMKCINKIFSFSFSEIYEMFNKPGVKYSQAARYGHFGGSDFPWEQTNKIREIKDFLHDPG